MKIFKTNNPLDKVIKKEPLTIIIPERDPSLPKKETETKSGHKLGR